MNGIKNLDTFFHLKVMHIFLIKLLNATLIFVQENALMLFVFLTFLNSCIISVFI